MKIRIYNVESHETLHEFEMSNKVKKESSIFQKVKEELQNKYGKEPKLIFQGVIFAGGKRSDDSGYINNLGIGKINYVVER